MPTVINVAFLPYCLEEAVAIPPQASKKVLLKTAFFKLPFIQDHQDKVDEFIVVGVPNIPYDEPTMAQILEGLLRNKSTTLPLTILILYQMWTTQIDPNTVLFTLNKQTYTYQDYLTSKQNYENHNILRQPYSRTQPGQFFLKNFETAYKTKLACLM